MKRFLSSLVGLVAVAVGGLGAGQSALAATAWNGSWNYSSCGDTSSSTISWGNSYNCTDTIAPANAAMNISAWSSDLSPSANFVTAAVRPWGSSSGFGIVNREECAAGATAVCDPGTGPHAADNVGNLEGFLLKFSGAPGEIVSVALNSITLGWNGTDNPTTPYTDSDLSVYYFAGAGSPDTSSITSTTAAQLATASTTVAVNGWKLLSHLTDVGAGSNTDSFNSGGVTSSWWFVTAKNSTSLTGTNGNDAFKLLAVAGAGTTSTTNKTPEPGTLALAGLAVFGAAYSRRKRKA